MCSRRPKCSCAFPTAKFRKAVSGVRQDSMEDMGAVHAKELVHAYTNNGIYYAKKNATRTNFVTVC